MVSLLNVSLISILGEVITESSSEELFELMTQLMNDCNNTNIIVENVNASDDPLQQKIVTGRSQYIQITPSNIVTEDVNTPESTGEVLKVDAAAVFRETTV
jgi:hypothetical protein